MQIGTKFPGVGGAGLRLLSRNNLRADVVHAPTINSPLTSSILLICIGIGHRHIIATQNLWLKEIAQIIAKEFKPQGYSVSTINCPYFALWVKGFFDKSVKLILPRVGKEIKFDSTRVSDDLSIFGI